MLTFLIYVGILSHVPEIRPYPLRMTAQALCAGLSCTLRSLCCLLRGLQV